MKELGANAILPSDSDVELHTYTRGMCIKLEGKTGANSWVENGGLFIACNKERLDEFEWEVEERLDKLEESQDESKKDSCVAKQRKSRYDPALVVHDPIPQGVQPYQ